MVQIRYLRPYLGIGICILPSVPTDAKDKHGLKLKNVRPTFPSIFLHL